MHLFYTLLWYLLLPFLFLRLWWRGRRAPAYRHRWRERLGFYDLPPLPGSIWIHAVSVGETVAAAPMVRALLRRYPDHPLVITTTTPTGSEQVGKLFGESVHHVYCPWDLPGALARFMRTFDPALVLIMETELWPNLMAAAAPAADRGVPVMLINGRLSEKSYRGYRRLSMLVRPLLRRFTRLLVQTEVEAERFRRLGAPAERVQVTGSIKFDMTLDAPVRQAAKALREQCGSRPIWIAASTHPGEDEAVLAAHRRILQHQADALLLLVPRHPERFNEVAALVRRGGFSLARRSHEEVPAQVEVYLADTMGELMMLYGCADVAFVAGSLVPVGGHNLLEPAAWGMPVLSGPHLHNFQRIAELLRDGSGLSVVENESQLAARVLALLADARERQRQGRAASAVMAAHQGALQRVLEEVASVLPVSPSSG